MRIVRTSVTLKYLLLQFPAERQIRCPAVIDPEARNDELRMLETRLTTSSTWIPRPHHVWFARIRGILS